MDFEAVIGRQISISKYAYLDFQELHTNIQIVIK